MGLSSCNPTSSIDGTYYSRFAEIGFFSTKIILCKDSSFTYRMQGNLIADTASGTYTVNSRILILSYGRILDTSHYFIDGRNLAMYNLSNASSRQLRYYIGHKKLFKINTKGQVVKHSQGFSKRKQFLFWRSHYMTRRRYFLNRLP